MHRRRKKIRRTARSLRLDRPSKRKSEAPRLISRASFAPALVLTTRQRIHFSTSSTGPFRIKIVPGSLTENLEFASNPADLLRMCMKNRCLAALLFCSTAAYAMPIATSARSMIPSEVQQIISVDYRSLKDSPTAQALKQQVLPENLKQFEAALKGIGIDAEHDLDQLTFASFRSGKQGLQVVSVAQGSFSAKAVLKRMKLKKIMSTKYGTALLYPMADGLVMTFTDDNTLAFGTQASLKSGLDARDGKRATLDSNSQMAEQMAAVDGSPVWSILDQQGTQAMMRSALSDASKIADYETLKKRILASRYTMGFESGVKFDLSVLTSDSMTAATLSSLVKAGMLYKKLNASPIEKIAIDSMTVDSDSSNLQVHFKTDDQKFQSLLHSELFAAVSR